MSNYMSVSVTDAQHGDEMRQADGWAVIDRVTFPTNCMVTVWWGGSAKGGSHTFPIAHRPAVRRSIAEESAATATEAAEGTVQTHTFLVAVEVTGDMTREQAEQAMHLQMPQPGRLIVGPGRSIGRIECWWVAEDDRKDGSDNDSAVFVSPGYQQAAFDLLRWSGMTSDCNNPTSRAV